MKQFFTNMLSAFDTHTKGHSARKWSAFIVILCIIVAHAAWLKYAFQKDDFSLFEGVLIIDYGFIATCLGMTTYQAIKTNNNNPTNEVV